MLILQLPLKRTVEERFNGVHVVPSVYSGTSLNRINWDGEPCGYAENPDNWIFL